MADIDVLKAPPQDLAAEQAFKAVKALVDYWQKV